MAADPSAAPAVPHPPHPPHPPALDEASVAARVAAELPHWWLEDGWLRRKYRTGGWKATTMVVGAVAHVAEQAWHHPDLSVSFAQVVVKLKTHAARGITERDFELAKRIEDVVAWRPAPGSTLEGTPDDPRFRHVKAD